jgi:CHASE2 domain
VQPHGTAICLSLDTGVAYPLNSWNFWSRIDTALLSIRQRQHIKAFAISLLAACIPAFLLEPLPERALSTSLEVGRGSLFDIHGAYRRRVVVGWRGEPTPKYTSIVEIKGGREPDSISMTNVCTQRLFLSYLLQKLDRSRPQMVVIDKYFSGTTCAIDDVGTKKFQDAVAKVSETTPIIIGMMDEPVNSSEDTSNGRYRAIPTRLPFPAGAKTNIKEGLLELAADKRTIPLVWRLFRDPSDQIGYVVNSLALEVALIHSPAFIQTRPALRRLIAEDRLPFTSFITSVPMEIVPAGAFVFGPGSFPREEAWPSAARSDPSPEFVNRLRGRIVFIGENRPYFDQWPMEFGTIPGVALWANYVESLLDERYFEPVPWYWNLLAGFLIFVLFHFLLIQVEEFVSRKKLGHVVHLVAAMVGTVAFLVVTFYILAAIVLAWGLYVDPLNLSLTAIWVSVLHVLFYRMDHSHGDPPVALASPGGTTHVSQMS